MGVGIDEPRGHQQAVGVELASTPADVVADLGDPITLDGDVGPPQRAAGAVDQGAVSNHQIGGHPRIPLVRSAGQRPAAQRLAGVGRAPELLRPTG